ncbi:MAG: FlgB family protein [Erythrobacter sp.]|nr:FlgB family protein [Erythrobacter sp.]
MFEKLQLTRMANTMAERAGARLGVAAQNIANADTPGYKAMDLPSFAETYRENATAMRATRTGHLTPEEGVAEPMLRRAKGAGAPNGNTVSLEQEMVKTANIRQDHDMALAIYRNTSDIIRASLGRAR